MWQGDALCFIHPLVCWCIIQVSKGNVTTLALLGSLERIILWQLSAEEWKQNRTKAAAKPAGDRHPQLQAMHHLPSSAEMFTCIGRSHSVSLGGYCCIIMTAVPNLLCAGFAALMTMSDKEWPAGHSLQKAIHAPPASAIICVQRFSALQ